MKRTGAAALAVVTFCGMLALSGTAGAAPSAKVGGVTVKKDAAAAKLLPQSYRSGLKMVTSAPFPPFEEYGSGHKLEGLTIDIGDALAAALGTKASWASIDFTGVIPALSAGKYDMMYTDAGDDKTRSKALNFVEYSLQGEVLVVLKSNPDHIVGLQSMCGHTLSVESGDAPAGLWTPVQKYCSSHNEPPMTVKTLPTTADALLALTSGSAQAQYVGVGSAPTLVKQNKGKIKIVNVPGQMGGYEALYVGVGLPKKSPLLKAVTAGMKYLLSKGILERLFSKYGLQDTLMKSIKVDAMSTGGKGLKL